MSSSDSGDEVEITERQLLGEKPRPRVLVVGAVPPGVAVFLSEYVPTVEVVDHLKGVNQDEWDLIVCSELLQVGDDKPAVIFVDQSDRFNRIVERTYEHTHGHSFGRDVKVSLSDVRVNEFVRPEPNGPLASLAEKFLIPLVKNDGSRRTYFEAHEVYQFVPFAVNSSGHALGGVYAQPQSGSARAVLPFDVPEPTAWLRALIGGLYRNLDPDTFRGIRDWDASREWMTGDEVQASDALVALRDERENALRQLKARQQDLEGKLAEARDRARLGPRRLLTEQGGSLVEAARIALESVGFVVETVDSDPERRGDALEDLRVVDPDESGWTAICEVRGYKRGAQLSDLIRISARFLPRYVAETKREPDALWYVVNHHKEDPPPSRPVPLGSNPDETETFAEANGLVIDTRLLFEIEKARASTPDDKQRMRAALRLARGIAVGLADLGAEPPGLDPTDDLAAG